MPTSDDVQTFLDAASDRLGGIIDKYYNVVDKFGADSTQALVARSLTGADYARALRDLHTQAAVMASDAGNLTDDARSVLDDIIAQDTDYGAGFIDDLPNLSRGQAMARAQMYVNTQRNTINEILALEVPTLPIYPQDDRLECTYHCKCRLDIRFLFGRGNFDIYWVMDVEAEHCESCIALNQEWNPLKIRKGQILSTKEVSAHDIAHLQRLIEIALSRRAA